MHNRLIRRIALAAFSIVILIIGLAIGSSSFIKDSSHTNGHVLLEFNTTWVEYLDWYLKENSDTAYYNPRPDLEKERKVRVVKTEYPKGLESKNGYEQLCSYIKCL